MHNSCGPSTLSADSPTSLRNSLSNCRADRSHRPRPPPSHPRCQRAQLPSPPVHGTTMPPPHHHAVRATQHPAYRQRPHAQLSKPCRLLHLRDDATEFGQMPPDQISGKPIDAEHPAVEQRPAPPPATRTHAACKAVPPCRPEPVANPASGARHAPRRPPPPHARQIRPRLPFPPAHANCKAQQPKEAGQ